MALSSINAVCKKCNFKFTGVPKRSFLGFQKLTCPTCQEKLTYPLTSGYRTTYWVLFGMMILGFINAISQGGFAYPGGFGIAIIFALIRDGSIRKRVSEHRKPGAPQTTSPAPPTPESSNAIQKAELPLKKASVWNYVGIGAGAFMLLFLFLPEMIRGTLARQYYLGAAFWIGVIIFCSINISRAKKRG